MLTNVSEGACRLENVSLQNESVKLIHYGSTAMSRKRKDKSSLISKLQRVGKTNGCLSLVSCYSLGLYYFDSMKHISSSKIKKKFGSILLSSYIGSGDHFPSNVHSDCVNVELSPK